MKFIIFIIIYLIMASDYALAYPESVRLSYSSCSACHVSPSGQGLLTKYGQATQEELAIYSKIGMGENLYGLYETPYSLLIGGDVRWLHFWRSDEYSDSYRRFLMQAELEVGLRLGKQITIVGSVGNYNLDLPIDSDQEFNAKSPRYYALIKPNRKLAIRVGKFFQAYGLMTSDHTLNIRRGLYFNQGQETYNLESTIYFKGGELILSHSNGNDEGMEAANTVRFAHYLTKRSQIGLSYYRSQMNEAFGLFSSVGFTKEFYLLSEIDRKESDKTLTYNLLGYEFIHGIHARVGHQYTSKTQNVYTYQFQIFPIPHLEFLLSYDRILDKDYEGNSYYFMSHYNF